MNDKLSAWQELERIAAQFGPDFYIADIARFVSNCIDFEAAFTTYITNTRPAYSVKTNYLPAFFKAATERGWYAEVVSGFEYELVRQHGVSGPDIIFNGPVKFPHEIERSLREGALLNIDSIDEVHDVAAFAKLHPDVMCRTALRCNLGMHAANPTRFGLSIEDTTFFRALEILRATDTPNLKLEGLHVHNCFPGKRPENYHEASVKLSDLLRRHALSGTLSSLNLGGGFFSAMPESMARQFGGNLPTAADYARAICEPLLAHFRDDPNLQLVLEPGLIVVADAMRFFCKIHRIKRAATGDDIIVTGSVYNVKPSKSRINMPLDVIKPTRPENAVSGRISGFTCMEDDILHADFSGDAAPGDYIAFYNVGAYTNALTPPFIRLAPPILAVSSERTDRRIKILCHAQSFQSLNERFPREQRRGRRPQIRVPAVVPTERKTSV